jgi:small subunit ribosomal protein S20
MANIKSQMKRNRQNVTRNLRNKAVRSELKTRTKAALAAAESGDVTEAAEALRLAQRRIDSAVSKGVLHKNTAARRKARLSRRVEELIKG